ncbi:MAG: adenosylhomocysteinase [Nocardioidaceae bacterium]
MTTLPADDAARGTDRIHWARQFMPALQAASETIAAEGLLRGRRVGVCLTLEPKTAALATVFADLGADVAVYCAGHGTDPQVAAALAHYGVEVFAEAGADEARDAELVDAFLDTGPELLVDDGAEVTRQLHSSRRDVLERLVGVAEETTSGVRPLRVMAAAAELEVPCIAVNDARSKSVFDNVYGTGQSVVMALLDLTNTQMQGKLVLVVGYGRVGQGIARFARSLGARVAVCEVDPVAALTAYHDGHLVGPLTDLLPQADVVFTATGVAHSLTADHVARMRPGALVAVGGAGPPELDPSLGPPATWGAELRPLIRELTVEGTTAYVVAAGECVNTTGGEGNPVEIMDLSLALQLHAVAYLAGHAEELGPEVYLLPTTVDDVVALAQLSAAGVGIDTPTREQLEATASW